MACVCDTRSDRIFALGQRNEGMHCRLSRRENPVSVPRPRVTELGEFGRQYLLQSRAATIGGLSRVQYVSSRLHFRAPDCRGQLPPG